jgi:5-methylcytosine-specific restriction endonuclease McrA
VRGTSNSNARGSSESRRRRRAFLVKTYAADVPGKCRCYRCGELLDEGTVTVDRIVPGCLGGRYVRENIRPACSGCNSEVGGGLRGAA